MMISVGVLATAEASSRLPKAGERPDAGVSRLRDTGRAMSEESTTPDAREIALHMAEASSRADFDAYMSHFAEDAVWVSRIGTRLEGITAIRSYTEEFNASVGGFRAELLEVHDLGGGVMFSTARQGGRPGGSASELREHVAYVSVLADGLVKSMTTYGDIDEARAAGERFAEERADG
jgi:uncharacterized protein (TIGR02246 family)